MLAEGVAMAPGAYEAIFVGLAHTDDVLDEIGDAAPEPHPSPPARCPDAKQQAAERAPASRTAMGCRAQPPRR